MMPTFKAFLHVLDHGGPNRPRVHASYDRMKEAEARRQEWRKSGGYAEPSDLPPECDWRRLVAQAPDKEGSE